MLKSAIMTERHDFENMFGGWKVLVEVYAKQIDIFCHPGVQTLPQSGQNVSFELFRALQLNDKHLQSKLHTVMMQGLDYNSNSNDSCGENGSLQRQEVK